MLKKLFPLFLVLGLVSSCGNSTKKEASSKNAGTTGPVKVEFASLIQNPGEYVGKAISVEGKVVHVCTESGKKIFITGSDPDVRLYVQAGENMPKFPMELLGSEIIVEGTLTQPAGAAAAEASEMLPGGQMKTCEMKCMVAGADTCETEKALAAQPVLADLMMVYNKHTVVK